ncbi:MAG TPA: TonB-dependent siderophore receptor [Dokdonella sp.]|uniref:TonB-dependent receptor n=1 Tax=Dokdonella sp. TaxID=2291710 RepID=UPI002D80DE46|nr:TonB-dependent siderophore receptor [Dokdonella sp.]HET9032088.1 TonB-dependent siderophore receptor [Dokdonella sp.]
MNTSAYRIPETKTATGTNTPLIDIPLSIQVIPDVVLRDQAAQTLADAVRNSPGISVNMGEGMRDEFYIRGVKTKSDFFVDGLRDDTEYVRDLYNISHVDVLQGPSALLFGRGGAGGLINLVSKQPERSHVLDISLEVGSWQHLRSTIDMGDAVGQSGAFRLLAMAEDSESFRDHYYLHRYALNPQYSIEPSERTRIDFSVSYLKDRRFVDRGIPSRDGVPVDVPRETFFGAPDQNLSTGVVKAFSTRFSHAYSDDLSLSNTFRISDADRVYLNTYPGSSVNDEGTFKMKGYYHPNNRLSYLDRLELINTFNTGSVNHTLMVGGDFSWQRDNDFQLLPSPDSKTVPGGRIPLANPEIAPVSFIYLDRDNHVVGKEFGVFVQDQMDFGEHWKALIGIRWDRFSVSADYYNPEVSPNHTYNLDTEWSPRAGLIYKPVENDSIYVSVTQTYTPQGANIALSRKDPKGANLDPEQATNVEIGNKLDLLDGKLSISAALFQLDLDDVVSKAADGSGDLVSTGKQRNRGFVLSTEGALTPKLSIFANYTHLNAEITETTKDADAGARVGLVPEKQFSLWTRYALNSHWGIAAGVRGESKKFTSYDNNVVLPKYVVGDLMAYYQTDNVRIQLNLNNVTDKHYFPTASSDNEIMPGTPRSLMMRVSTSF